MSGGEISGNSASVGGGGVYSIVGTFAMSGGKILGNSVFSTAASASASANGGGVHVQSFIMTGGEISGNSAFSTASSAEGGGVYASTVTKGGGVIYGSNADDALKNTAVSGISALGHGVYVYSGTKIRNTTAAAGVTLDSSKNGTAGGWESAISIFSFQAGNREPWILESDGRRRSLEIGHNKATEATLSFMSIGDNASLTIQLAVSSEQDGDFAYISKLDDSAEYPGSRISGTDSVSITIPVPTAGTHWVRVVYEKNGSQNAGSDCAWFRVIE
jgi:hypothetical protein